MNKRAGLRSLAGILLGLVLGAALVVSHLEIASAASWIEAASAWTRAAGPAGWAAFIAGQMVVAMIGFIPASLLGVASGAVYGVFGGFPLAALGTMVGGWLAFLLARSLLRPVVETLLARRPAGSRLARLDAELSRDGWRFVCLLRISPVMPFAVTSYALGLSEITASQFLLGTLASLPALFGYVALGALAHYGVRTAAGQATPFGWLLIAAGAVATLLLILRSGVLLARCGLLPGAARPPA